MEGRSLAGPMYGWSADYLGNGGMSRSDSAYEVVDGIAQDEVGSLAGTRHRAIIAARSRPRMKKDNNTYEMRNIRGRN